MQANQDGIPRAVDLEYENSTLDVAYRGEYVELTVDKLRVLGNTEWIRIDRDHFVEDLRSMC
ncbi:hypothetical protein [Haladaptatus sp. DJG-WS-42]